MECERCGAQLDAEGRCLSCEAKEARVRVMTREEKRNYQGITIEEDGAAEDIRFERRENPWQRVRWTTVGTASWSDRLLVGLVVAGIVAFIFFVALPVAALVILIGIVGWLLSRIFSL